MTQADQIRQFVPRKYFVLGTDGFGRSDTRSKLRYFFEVDSHYIAMAALHVLLCEKKLTAKQVSSMMKKLKAFELFHVRLYRHLIS